MTSPQPPKPRSGDSDRAAPEGGVPRHVAIIMDGNNRWAKARGLSGVRGHRAGVEAVRAVIRRAAERDIETLTLFAFSSENWKRPKAEVSALMELFLMALKREVRKLHDNGIRLSVIGDRTAFSDSIQKYIAKAEEKTRDNTRMHLVVAANYGGRWDIAGAARRLAERVAAGELSPDAIDEHAMDGEVCLAGDAPVDLCIRTSGEQRISNFLLWQMAYAELHFTPLLWPDFDGEAFDLALADFQRRQRRFGMTDEQVEAQGA
ncbi:polyprenyl diphosphate synthase [Halomonas heilongjiangensis]|uniref:Ditrans,polycis-undecaprenyl-diphosphate synthase ((2E,6E)-farnesyl-diphosphate specific) n=1 Tax=Halomonas heilongjiangensis TaxID=1387883 RepID=A0A2N7TFF7_9GAMM|nr:polyprenyl diphosphate synthase [Halomonas heilongjiangensis]PMR66895.1 di-trans,poly-cis-decaprenylcistransferase [Halomonas heilongjiangensis]PXX91273.1 di-trans,poly-cis-decaprenylcistransferase [Halomonas heilongjiangensis]